MNWEAQRRMDKDVEENREYYEALGNVEISEERESFAETVRQIIDEDRDILDALAE